jgi:uncharacterized protein YndB with AHSA1/START domain
MTLTLWLLLAAAGAFAQGERSAKSSAADPYVEGVKNTSYVAARGERVLRHEGFVPAPPSEVWKVFESAEGISTWVAPTIAFDLKTGGRWHANYKVGSKPGDPGTIYNTVLGYVPEEMLAIKVGLTDAFPEGPRQAGTLFAITQLYPASGGQTRVATSMLGWGEGKDWDEVYAFFDRGNRYTLGQLVRRFREGPRDWTR